MKQFSKLLAILCVLALLAGCGTSRPTDVATEAPYATGNSDDQPYTLYFPDDAPCLYSHDINPDRTAHVNELIKTNTTQISVKNNSSFTIVANLYYPEDLDYVIQTHTIKPGKTLEFSGLTSRFTYCIGFEAEETGTLEVKISG